MAVALTWLGYVDTDLQFSEFFSGDHTIMIRFMPQYVNAYLAPIICEASENYVLAQEKFSEVGTQLLLKIGSDTILVGQTLTAGVWYHLAVVRKGNVLTLYLDGQQLSPTITNAGAAPSGFVRLGKLQGGPDGGFGQFYGLLDDLAVFKKALSQSQIANIAVNVPKLTGSEQDLYAGFVFNSQSAKPPALSRSATLQGAAFEIATSANRNNSADAKVLPLPAVQHEMQLPFQPLQAWRITQGYDNAAGSHKGTAAFAWDFVLAENGSETKGAPQFACAPGKVTELVKSKVNQDPSGGGNFLYIKQGPDEFCAYLHFEKDSSKVGKGQLVQMGQELAATGDTGNVKPGDYHAHVAVSNLDGGNKGNFVTFPVAFTDYEVSSADNPDKWTYVPRGVPKSGDWIRRTSKWGPWISLGGEFKDSPAAVSRNAKITDVFVRGLDDRLWQKTFESGKGWGKWQVHNDGFITSSPAADSMGSNHVHVFARGKDGALWQKWWTLAAGWSGWNSLGGEFKDSPAAVSRNASITDVFVRGLDDRLWQKTFESGKGWGKWQVHNDGFITSSPTADSMGSDHVHVFARGKDGALWQKWWTLAAGWSGWNSLGGEFKDSPAAVSRNASITDVFVRGLDDRLWHKTFKSGRGWNDWHRHHDGLAIVTSLAADSMHDHHVHIFVRGADGALWQKWWVA